MGVRAHGCLLPLGARPGSRVEVARLTVVSGAGVLFPRWRGPDVGGPAPWGHMRLGLVLQLVAVRWLGMVLADPRAAPGSRSWPAAASAGYPPVPLRSWAGTWLPSSR